MTCLCTNVDLILNPDVVEVFALRKAMEFCLELGVQSVVFEGMHSLLYRQPIILMKSR